MLLSNMELLATAPGGVAKLRELILTLAVQGKLVPQDPADEPAGVLLQKIRAEKDRLIAEGKIKRDKPLAEIAEEEKPFELPESWEWSRLGALASKLTDGSHNPPRDSGAGYPMLSSQNVWEGGVVDFTSPTRYVGEADFLIENSRTAAVPGDVLLTIVASLGRSAVVPIGAPAFVLQRSVAVIRSGLNPEFCSLFLRSPVARAYYDLHGKGTAQKGIYLGKLGAMPIAVPPLAEQSRIVTRVEALMRLCDALEAKGQLEATQHAQLVSTLLGTLTASTTSEELAANWQRVAQHFDLLLDRPEAIDALEQTLLQLAVRGLLVPQDPTDEPASALLQKIRAEKDRLIATGQIKKGKPLPPITDEEKPFELPAGWEWVPLGEVVEIIRGITFPASEKTKEKAPGRIACLRTANVQEQIEWDDLLFIAESFVGRGDQRVQIHDIVMSMANSRELVGKVALVEHIPHEAATFGGFLGVLRPWFLEPRFVMALLRTPYARASLIDSASQTTNIANVSLGKLRPLAFPLPPLAEQSRIVTRVTALRRLCADLRQRLAERQSVQARLAEALMAFVA